MGKSENFQDDNFFPLVPLVVPVTNMCLVWKHCLGIFIRLVKGHLDFFQKNTSIFGGESRVDFTDNKVWRKFITGRKCFWKNIVTIKCGAGGVTKNNNKLRN